MADYSDNTAAWPEIPLGLTFDDVLLQPLESSVLPSQAETRTFLTRDIPLDPRNFASLRSTGYAACPRGLRALWRVNPVVHGPDGARLELLQL